VAACAEAGGAGEEQRCDGPETVLHAALCAAPRP